MFCRALHVLGCGSLLLGQCDRHSNALLEAGKITSNALPQSVAQGRDDNRWDRKSTPSTCKDEAGGSARFSSPQLNILHCNGEFAAVCKPPRMHVHRPECGTGEEEFVLQKARDQLGHRIYLPHRLDRGTSGCLLLGFSPEAVKVLHQALAHSASRKTYVAIVRGSGQAYVGKGWFTVDRPIKDEKKIAREATTRFVFVKGGCAPEPRVCLVLAQPLTGRFHQIRRHLNGINHPIVGDSLHGSSRFNREMADHVDNPAPSGRLMLHCLRLKLPTLFNADSKEWRKAEKAEEATTEKECTRGQDSSDGNGFNTPSSYRRSFHSGGGNSMDTSAPAKPDEGCSCDDDDDDDDDDCLLGQSLELGVPRRRQVEPIVIVENKNETSSSIMRAQASVQPRGKSGFEESKEVGGQGGGFEVYAEPPEDMMAYLRGMSWWQEDIIQEAERSGW